MSTLQPAGPSAEAIAIVWWWMFGVSMAVLVGVCALWLVAMRSKRMLPHEEASRVGRRWLIGGGIVLPSVAVIALMVAGTPAGFHQLPLAGRTQPDPQQLQVNVQASRWRWELHYPAAGVTTVNELRLPVGQTVAFHVTSDDVIHSFWVPRLGGKLDAIPGRVQVLLLRADQEGTFLGHCAEFCGQGHAHMGMVVHAMAPQAFAQWLAAEQARAQGNSTR